mgnify:CR=1 FL=1
MSSDIEYKKNAPSFIYEILYGKPKYIRGRTAEHRQKIWNGYSVDENIPTKALDELNRIKEIELRSSCEGSGPEKTTYLIFRFRDQLNPEEIKRFVKGMNAIEDIKCGTDIGNMGLYRVGVTTPLWYEKDKEHFIKWWLELPTKIQIVLATTKVLASELADLS